MSPGQNVTQEVRAKRHPVGQGKMSQGNTSQGKTSPRAKRLRAECHPTLGVPPGNWTAGSSCLKEDWRWYLGIRTGDGS